MTEIPKTTRRRIDRSALLALRAEVPKAEARLAEAQRVAVQAEQERRSAVLREAASQEELDDARRALRQLSNCISHMERDAA